MKDHRSHREALQIQGKLDRRQFVSGALTAAASVSSLAALANVTAHSASAQAPPVDSPRKIKLGVVGNGGRGAWIAELFQKHGGYEMYAVADYFQEVADKCGDELGVDKTRRFSALSGYKRLIESGVEAVALETPPYFFPGACPRGGGCGSARLHGQAGGRGCARGTGNPRGRQTSHREEAVFPRGLPDAHRSAQHRDRQADRAPAQIGKPAVSPAATLAAAGLIRRGPQPMESRLPAPDLVQRHRAGRQPPRQRLHSRH